MKFSDNRPTVIKECEPDGVSVLYPVTPQRISMFKGNQRHILDAKEGLKSHMGDCFMAVTNRASRRRDQKPFRPFNLRRLQRNPGKLDSNLGKPTDYDRFVYELRQKAALNKAIAENPEKRLTEEEFQAVLRGEL